jgi:hypothetical protein
MSVDFLGFKFGKSVYASMMEEQVAKKGKMCAVMCHLKTIEGIQVVWLTHDFTFFGAPLPPRPRPPHPAALRFRMWKGRNYFLG